jgi:hypothetical protein
MLEQAINEMTAAIDRLNITIGKMNLDIPTTMNPNEHPALQQAADRVSTIYKEDAAKEDAAKEDAAKEDAAKEDAAKEVEIDKVDAPKPKATRKKRTPKEVVTVELDEAVEVPVNITRDDLQMLVVATVQRDRALKALIKEKMIQLGASKLPDLNDDQLNDFAVYVRGL